MSEPQGRMNDILHLPWAKFPGNKLRRDLLAGGSLRALASDNPYKEVRKARLGRGRD